MQHHGYLTNIITDRSLDWLENERDPEKPFCLMIHHKAIHRDWLPDTCDLELYEDRTFEYPANFNDDYKGRPAAEAAEMRIGRDMDLIYDLKMIGRPSAPDSMPSTARLSRTSTRRIFRGTPSPAGNTSATCATTPR